MTHTTGPVMRRFGWRAGAVVAVVAAMTALVLVAFPSGASGESGQVAPTLGNDAYSVPIGTTLHLAAPGLRVNDDPLPDGRHLHVQTTLASSGGYARLVNLADDGSVDITVYPLATAGNSYDLEYCYGTSDIEGSPCTSNTATVTVTALALNVGNDAYSVPIGTTLHLAAPGLRVNDDPLPDGLHLHVRTTLASSGGYARLVNLADDGSVDITVYPLATAGNSYDLEYCYGTSDIEGSPCTSNTATVTVTAVAPALGDDSYTVTIGTFLHLPAPGLLVNDDPLGTDLHVHLETTLASSAGYARLVNLADDGSVDVTVYDTATNGNVYDLEYCYGTTNVEGSECKSNIATVHVTAVTNQAPIASNDSYTTPYGTTLHIAAPGVLANDSDSDGEPITAAILTPPPTSQGTATIAATGELTFLPAEAFTGTATFTYQADDGEDPSAPATVSVTVGPPPQTSTTTTTTTTTPSTTTTGTPPQPVVRSDELARTGVDSRAPMAWAFALITVGSALVIVGRRRRRCN